jgi:hypothetical protein
MVNATTREIQGSGEHRRWEESLEETTPQSELKPRISQCVLGGEWWEGKQERVGNHCQEDFRHWGSFSIVSGTRLSTLGTWGTLVVTVVEVHNSHAGKCNNKVTMSLDFYGKATGNHSKLIMWSGLCSKKHTFDTKWREAEGNKTWGKVSSFCSSPAKRDCGPDRVVLMNKKWTNSSDGGATGRI